MFKTTELKLDILKECDQRMRKEKTKKYRN